MADSRPTKMGLSEREENVVLTPELARLQEGITHLEDMRILFADMQDDGERDRAWRYLTDRFGEFEKADMPGWENLSDA
jgi:hypothetical protein